MFDKLANGIPLAEASAFFVGLKSFDKTADATNASSVQYGPPDETGELEGKFQAPAEQVLEHMARMVQNELKTQYAYMVYANSLRDLAHHGIAESFEEHADDETEHADWLLRRMGVLGGPISVPDIPAPPAATDAAIIVQTMVRMEQEGIENWRILRQMVGDENPTKFKIEEYLTQEQEHLDELWQLVPAEQNSPVLAQRAGAPVTEMPQVPPSAPETTAAIPEIKTAAAIERFHPGTLGYHGEAVKLALMQGNTKGSVVIPNIGLDGESKTAAAKLLSKEKDAEMPGMAGGLPPTAMGQQMQPATPPPLPPTGMGQQAKIAFQEALRKLSASSPEEMAEAEKHQAQLGHSRAIANLSSGFTQDAHSRGERAGDLVGRMAGASLGGVGGALAGHLAGHSPALSLAMAAGGATMGQHLGGKAGRFVGQEHDAKKFHEKYGSAFKLALDEMTAGIPSAGGADGQLEGVAPQAPQMDPELMAYMQQEQQGMDAEHEGEQAFYKQKFEQASQALQAAQQAAQATTQQVEQLQQQVDAGAQQQQQALNTAKVTQDAAMQNAQAAHQAASQAMQQTLQAQNDSMQQAQLAVGMRDSVHAMRQSLMEMVQQQLPPATPAEAGAIQADMMAQQQGLAAGGQDNTAQPGPDGSVAPDQAQAGQPAASPDAGTPPASATPGDGNGAGTSPSAGAGAKPVADGATPQSQQGTPGEPAKTASSHDRLIGAILGGTVGGAGALVESKMSNDPLRAKVDKLDAVDKAGGGFGNALNLAQARARLALGELSERHPVGAVAMGAGLGALRGATAAPGIRSSFGG